VSTKYLLPCSSCDRRIEVAATQAGREVRCQCGAAMEVPTLQGLARLERAEPGQAPPRTPSRWGVRQRLVLVGLVTLLVAVGLGAAFHWNRPRTRSVDEITLSQTWHLWQNLRQGPDLHFPYEEDRYKAFESYRRWMGVAVVLAAIGIATMAGSLLVPRR
jgi:hypothetical protein